VVSRVRTVSLGQHSVVAAELIGGRQVGIRIEATTLALARAKGGDQPE
jgi:hypothetical protein